MVDEFHPAGSVKANVRVLRKPLCGPMVKEEGHLLIDADLDLNPRCEITWVGLPYTVRNLTGRLELHPDRWEFKNMRGRNGQAVITGNGRVQKLPGPKLPNGEPPLKIDLQIAGPEPAVQRRPAAGAPAGLAEDLVDYQPHGDQRRRRPRSMSSLAGRTRTISRSRRGPSRACGW